MKNSLNGRQILIVMTDIEEEYIHSAWQRLDYLPRKETRKCVLSILKGAAMFMGILIFVMTTTVATAMAIDEEFREAVKEIIIEFFHIEEQEIVPELSGTEEVYIDNMYVELQKSILGGVIEGRYVHAPASCHAREGVYMICTDEIELNQGSHYDAYYEENGEFVKLKEQTFRGDYSVLGNDFHIKFDWAEYGSQVALTYMGVEENYRIPANPGNADAMLVELICSIQIEEGEQAVTAYPVLLNLETGELKDVLAGTGAEKLINLCNQAISEDKSKMLLAQTDGTLYYVDLVLKKLYSVEELSNEAVDACSLIGNTLACWVLEEEGYRAWSIDLTTFERREVFSEITPMYGAQSKDVGIACLSGFDTAVHWGTMFTGNYFALEVVEEGNVVAIDLVTGEKISIEGFLWPDDIYEDILWEVSPDGKRLLICGGQIGVKYEYMGVLDFEKMSYLEFTRENGNAVSEWKPYWFDKDTVIIQATSKDNYYVQDYYVYDIK